MSVEAVLERAERPAFVRFKRRSVENKAESLKQSKYVGLDIDYALVTPPYSKDVVEIKVDQWLLNLEQDKRNNRIPASWVDMYQEQYRRWKAGEEMPVNGTPIRGWGVTSPTQQEMLIRLNILTVEDLAGVNDEGLRRIGMGAMELKNKAVAWLRTLNDRGPLTQENAALKRENEVLQTQLATALKQNEALMAMLAKQTDPAPPGPVADGEVITASDLLDDEPPKKRK